MRKQLFIFFYGICLFLFYGFRQQTNLPNLITKEYYDYIQSNIANGNIEQAIAQYDTLGFLATAHKDSLHMALAHSCVGEIYFMYNQMEKSKDAFLASAKYTQKFHDKDLYIKDCIRLLGTYKTLGIQDSAFHFMDLVDQLIKKEGIDSLKHRMFYNQKAIFYQYLGKSDSAVHYYINASKLIASNDIHPQIAVYGNLSRVFASRMNYQKALEYSNKILSLPSIENYPRGLTTTLINKGQALKHTKQYEEAEVAILEAIQLEENQQIKVYWGSAITELTDIYLRQGNIKAAKMTLNKITNPEEQMRERFLPNFYITSIKIALFSDNLAKIPAYLKFLQKSIESSTKYFSYTIEFQYLKAQYLSAIGDDNAANTALKDYIALKDSLYTVSQSNIIHDLETVYQTELKENEIKLLNTKNDLATAKLFASHKQLLGLSIGLLILGGLVYRVLNLNKKLEIAIEQKDFLLKEIHHRVKNNLQFISSLLSLQSEYVEDQNALVALQEGQDRVQSMSLIHQKLYQKDNLTSIHIKEYFENLTENLFDSYNVKEDKIKLHLHIDDVQVDVDTAIPLGLIVNELISNSLKYAFPNGQTGNIEVLITEQKDALQLLVKDDGIGIKENVLDNLNVSFGYKLIQAFKTQLEAELSIRSKNGTQVELLVPDYKKTSHV